jgi:hypothetical protein
MHLRPVGKRVIRSILLATLGQCIEWLGNGTEKIVTALHDTFKAEYVAPGHCTGEPAFTALKKRTGQRLSCSVLHRSDIASVLSANRKSFEQLQPTRPMRDAWEMAHGLKTKTVAWDVRVAIRICLATRNEDRKLFPVQETDRDAITLHLNTAWSAPLVPGPDAR